MEELPRVQYNFVVSDQKCKNLALYKNNWCTNATVDLYYNIFPGVKTVVNQEHLIENQRVYLKQRLLLNVCEMKRN